MKWGNVSLLCNELIIYFICEQNGLKLSKWRTELVAYFRTKHYMDTPILLNLEVTLRNVVYITLKCLQETFAKRLLRLQIRPALQGHSHHFLRFSPRW